MIIKVVDEYDKLLEKLERAESEAQKRANKFGKACDYKKPFTKELTKRGFDEREHWLADREVITLQYAQGLAMQVREGD